MGKEKKKRRTEGRKMRKFDRKVRWSQPERNCRTNHLSYTEYSNNFFVTQEAGTARVPTTHTGARKSL